MWPVVVFCAAAAMGSLALGATSAAAAPVSVHAREAAQNTATSTDEQEAVASYQALQAFLYEPSVQLYQGLPSNSCDPYSCLWPFTNAMAGTELLYASPGGSGYASDMSARLNGLLAYADLKEISPNGRASPERSNLQSPRPRVPGATPTTTTTHGPP